jgi:hypothetical protein
MSVTCCFGGGGIRKKKARIKQVSKKLAWNI